MPKSIYLIYKQKSLRKNSLVFVVKHILGCFVNFLQISVFFFIMPVISFAIARKWLVHEKYISNLEYNVLGAYSTDYSLIYFSEHVLSLKHQFPHNPTHLCMYSSSLTFIYLVDNYKLTNDLLNKFPAKKLYYKNIFCKHFCQIRSVFQSVLIITNICITILFSLCMNNLYFLPILQPRHPNIFNNSIIILTEYWTITIAKIGTSCHLVRETVNRKKR
jgi:hypothetical protein